MRSIRIRDRPIVVSGAEVTTDHAKAGGESLSGGVVVAVGEVVDQNTAGLRHGLEGTIGVLEVESRNPDVTRSR